MIFRNMQVHIHIPTLVPYSDLGFDGAVKLGVIAYQNIDWYLMSIIVPFFLLGSLILLVSFKIVILATTLHEDLAEPKNSNAVPTPSVGEPLDEIRIVEDADSTISGAPIVRNVIVKKVENTGTKQDLPPSYEEFLPPTYDEALIAEQKN